MLLRQHSATLAISPTVLDTGCRDPSGLGSPRWPNPWGWLVWCAAMELLGHALGRYARRPGRTSRLGDRPGAYIASRPRHWGRCPKRAGGCPRAGWWQPVRCQSAPRFRDPRSPRPLHPRARQPLRWVVDPPSEQSFAKKEPRPSPHQSWPTPLRHLKRMGSRRPRRLSRVRPCPLTATACRRRGATRFFRTLPARVKAVYSAGAFVAVDDDGAHYALPNAAHRDHCV